MGLEYEAPEKWFYKVAEKYQETIGWWIDLEEEF